MEDGILEAFSPFPPNNFRFSITLLNIQTIQLMEETLHQLMQ